LTADAAGLLPETVKTPHARRALAFLAVALGLAVVALRLWVGRVAPLPGDEAVAARLPSPRVPHPLLELTRFFDTLAAPLVTIATVAAVTWLVASAFDRRRAAGVVLAAAAAGASTALKLLWGPTPLQLQVNGAEHVNYPSGHVTYATAFFGYLAYLALERRQFKAAALLVALVAGMGPSRIVDGSHFPSDVLGAYLLGALWLIGVILWTTARDPRTPHAAAPRRSPASSALGHARARARPARRRREHG
jgi:undecaprenyl-diphosphatase